MSLPILILAGGASTRMGPRDKLTELVDDVPLLRRQAKMTLQVSSTVTVLLRPGNSAARSIINDLPIKIIEPVEALEGIGGSIRAGTKAHLDDSAFMFLLADLVDLTKADLQLVIDAYHSNQSANIWRAVTATGAPGHPIIFGQNVYPDLLKLRGDTGGQQIIEAHKGAVTIVPLPQNRARQDLDTPEQWKKWRQSRQFHIKNR